MSHGKSDNQLVETVHNTARYFTENRHVAWMVLLGTIAWGCFGYLKMPKRKDPEIQVRVAAAIAAWPGASAEKIEEQITRRIEEKIAESSKIERIDSTTRTGVAVVTVTLQENIKDTGKEFDDIKLRLDSIRDLPPGARPIEFLKDFGDTTALMLTVASPTVSEIEIQLRADSISRGISKAREDAPGRRVSLVYGFPASLDPAELRRALQPIAAELERVGMGRSIRTLEGAGFMGLDLATDATPDELRAETLAILKDRLRTAELHPDVWRAIVVVDPATTERELAQVAESKYSYRELDDFTDLFKRRLENVAEVAKVSRSGVLPEQIHLDFSQERLASYGVQQTDLQSILGARNITVPAGIIETPGKNLALEATGELSSENELGALQITAAPSGAPVYLRDLVEVSRDYESPAHFLNKYTARDNHGTWRRTRAITLAVAMRSGEQVGRFGEHVDAAIAEARKLVPEDLVIARTSDQPRQVEENLALFMRSLFEAIVLVVVVALIGFWEWRSALLLALSIPLTLAMTFGIMYALGIDLQQVSVASLIIALGLLVDDPVVANDAIKRSLRAGWKPLIAAWLGPTKLATAILFATITNIVAYLPFLILPGDTGSFVYSLPVVLTFSLIASRIVSMTFIPLLGYYLLRKRPEEEVRAGGRFVERYRKLVGSAIDHRWKVFAGSIALILVAFVCARELKQSFFPKDLSYLSYVDIWLPVDAPIADTNEVVRHADQIIRETLEPHGLKSITTFVGGGGPRFWFSVSPEQQQLNYAQMIIEVEDKHETEKLVPILQAALSSELAGARADVQQLENGKAVGSPVSIRISGEEIGTLRAIAGQVAAILRDEPKTERTHDDWGPDSFKARLDVDNERANLAGVTNLDVARASASALNGNMVGSLREGNRTIPIMTRMRAAERAQVSDIENLYVRGSLTGRRVPLRQVASVAYGFATEKIIRRDHHRTITVATFPSEGTLPSEVMDAVRGRIKAVTASLPPGYKLEIGGEEEERLKGFANLVTVLLISIIGIFAALVVQFKNAVKPVIVFAAIPYGVAGALLSLVIAGSPFGFMAFLGIISLIGVIVSHVIVLFDFIEEQHEAGADLRDALIEAGIQRLRPVMITVAATVFALIPLAMHGGPLWEPISYAQMGGLTIATFVTLLMVPVLYAIFVLDLRLVRWERGSASDVHRLEDRIQRSDEITSRPRATAPRRPI
jgi:multidrug efflux pump